MKKMILTSLIFMFTAAPLCANSLKSLEDATMRSDLGWVENVLQEVELTAQDQARFVVLADDMISFRRDDFKIKFNEWFSYFHLLFERPLSDYAVLLTGGASAAAGALMLANENGIGVIPVAAGAGLVVYSFFRQFFRFKGKYQDSMRIKQRIMGMVTTEGVAIEEDAMAEEDALAEEDVVAE